MYITKRQPSIKKFFITNTHQPVNVNSVQSAAHHSSPDQPENHNQAEITDRFYALNHEMMIRLDTLCNEGINDESVERFFTEVEELQTQYDSSTNIDLRSADKHDECFGDLSRIHIYYNNVQCIPSKSDFCTMIEMSFYKILCFTETWLTCDYSNCFFPDKYNVYRCDREKLEMSRRAGGVAIIVHRKIISKTVMSENIVIDAEKSECLAVEIILASTKAIIYVAYMSKFNTSVANKHLELINELRSNYPDHLMIVLGDFNIHGVEWCPDESHTHFVPVGISTHTGSIHLGGAASFLRSIDNMSLHQLSNITNNANNVLDLVFVSNYDGFKINTDQNTIIHEEEQDQRHKPFHISFEYYEEKAVNINDKKLIYCYKKGNYDRMCQQLEKINFIHEFNQRDVNSAFDFFHSTMNKLVQCNIPQIAIKRYSNKPKWWNKELQARKNRRNKLHKQQRGVVSHEYSKANSEFNELNNKLRNDYYERVQANIAANPAEFWNFAKLNNGSSSYPSQMHFVNNKGDTAQDIVNLFADYFESIHREDRTWHFDETFVQSDAAREINVTQLDIEMAINSLKWKGGVGPDGVSPFIVKKCVKVIVWPLWLLFRKTFDDGIIPDVLKVSRVVPVYKKGPRSNVENYRVVAISSLFLKIFEKAVKFRLCEKIETKLSNAQHGFRKNRSVTTNLLNLSIVSHQAFYRSNQVDVFYGDFKTAFDRVCHRRLIEKLAPFDVGIKTAKWICEFITNRKNYVQIGGKKSKQYESKSGVPAGSALGPILFLIFIDDVVSNIKDASVLLFADDIKIFKEIKCYHDTLVLQNEINNTMDWCERDNLPMNRQKCAVFSLYRTRAFIKKDYTIGDYIVERKNEIRDLGILFDHKLHFGHHIEQITAHARQMCGYIKRISRGKFNMNTQKILYTAYVRSKLEFASAIWSPHSAIYIDDIESVQKQFIIHLLDSRRNASSYVLTPYLERCNILKLKSLVLRRNICDALLAFDIYKAVINDNLIQCNFRRTNNLRNTRNVGDRRTLIETVYAFDYLQEQPLCRLIRLINENINIFNLSICKKTFKFRIAVILENKE